MRQEVNGGGKVGEEEVKDVRVNGGRLKRREHAGGFKGGTYVMKINSICEKKLNMHTNIQLFSKD